MVNMLNYICTIFLLNGWIEEISCKLPKNFITVMFSRVNQLNQANLELIQNDS